MIVNRQGQRYVNEMLYGASIGMPMVEDHEGVCWIILDDEGYRRAKLQSKSKTILAFQRYPALAAMLLRSRKASSIRSLARKSGIDADGLEAAVASYNRIAETAAPDPFGKALEDVGPITKGPFHAINMSIDAKLGFLPVLTLGGLKVNEASGAVLDKEGRAIPGLYAAGRNAVGICSNIYVSGLSVADCIFSGRRAARSLAELG